MMRDGFFWFVSERSSLPAVGQFVKGQLFLVGEEGPVSYEEVKRRGWEIHGLIRGQNKQYPRIKK
jgi:hypothetical protein